jgi:hypothetical protein
MPKKKEGYWDWGYAEVDFKDYFQRYGEKCFIDVVDRKSRIRGRVLRWHREYAYRVDGAPVVWLLGPIDESGNLVTDDDRLGLPYKDRFYEAREDLSEYLRIRVDSNDRHKIRELLPKLYKAPQHL